MGQWGSGPAWGEAEPWCVGLREPAGTFALEKQSNGTGEKDHWGSGPHAEGTGSYPRGQGLNDNDAMTAIRMSGGNWLGVGEEEEEVTNLLSTLLRLQEEASNRPE